MYGPLVYKISILNSHDLCHALAKTEGIISPVELPPCRHRYRQVVLVSAGGQRSYLTNFDSAEVLKILRWNKEDNKVGTGLIQM